MNFAVLGLGRTGHTITSYLLNQGHQVRAWTRNPESRGIIRKSGVTITGAIEGRFHPVVEETVEAAVADAQYILVMTTAEGHKPIAGQLKGCLRPKQRIIIFNCNWGAFEFYRTLGKELADKDIIVAETSGMMLMSVMSAPGICHLKAIKSRLGIAAIPKTKCRILCEELTAVFPQFYEMDNVLETSLNVTNPIIHTAVNLFNLASIENGQEFYIYRDAATPLAVHLAEKLDEERLAVMSKLGIHGVSCKEILEQAWGFSSDSLFRILKDTKSYQQAKGPTGFQHRHFTEDVPFGMAPIQALGRRFDVATPVTDTIISCLEVALDRDFTALAPDLDCLEPSEFI